MFRSIIFWSHLVAGVIAGAAVLIMSITAVLLTYERQIISLVERSFYVEPTAQALSVDELAIHANEAAEGARGLSLTFHNNARAPVAIPLGREGSILLDPYSGEVVGEGAVKTKAFFAWATQFHRWFALTGENRATGKFIMDGSNLLFLFLVISGIYIWFPKVMRWPAFRMNMLFGKGLPTAKARDYNWHHVFGFWALIPIFLMVITGLVMSYGWANNMVYTVYGEEAPVRGGARGAAGGGGAAPDGLASVSAGPAGERLSLDQLLDVVKNYEEDWTSIRVTLPSATASTVNFTLDTGTGGEPTKQSTLSLNRAGGSIANISVFTDNSPGQQTRSYFRRLHTGESLGFIGQTIAGIASLAICFLVYTGIALAYRRVLQPLFKKKPA